MRSLRLARFGDNMRDVAVTEGDKVEAELRFGVSVNTYGVNDLVAVVDQVAEAQIDDLVKEYDDTFRVAAELRPGGDRHDSLRYAARIELGLRTFLEAGGFRAFTTNFEDLGGLRQLPGIAVQRLMADGYGFGGEGDWKTSVLVRTVKAMAVGAQGGTSFMEDYTYDLTPGQEMILGAHMLEVCPTIAAGVPNVEIHPLSIGGREDPVRLVFDAEPGPAVVLGLADMGERFRLVANEVDVVPPRSPCPGCRWPGPSGGPARTWPARPRPGSPRGLRTTPCCPRGSGWRNCTTSPRWPVPNWSSSTRTPTRVASPTNCAGTRRTTAWPAASERGVTGPAARGGTRHHRGRTPSSGVFLAPPARHRRGARYVLTNVVLSLTVDSDDGRYLRLSGPLRVSPQ